MDINFPKTNMYAQSCMTLEWEANTFKRLATCY